MTDKNIYNYTARVYSDTVWHLYGDITDHEQYEVLINYLNLATESDKVILRINSPGGHLDVGFMVVEAIKKTKAIVIAHVVWPSASMASVIACACHAIVFEPNTYLMFHTYSTGAYGKSDDLYQSVISDDRVTHNAIKSCIYPFLTAKEISKMRDGKDVYVYADDDDLNTRIKRHFKMQKL